MFLSTGVLLLSVLCHNAAAFVGHGEGMMATVRMQKQQQQQPHSFELRATPGVVVDADKDLQSLLGVNRKVVDALSSISSDVSETARLRFALAFGTQSEAEGALRSAVRYRGQTKGKSVVDAAKNAYDTATAADNGWDNEVVRNAAPHANVINRFITSKNIITSSTDAGDLVYVIRASLIDDKTLMDNVSIDQLSEFFMYVKEVHSLVANARTERTGRLCEVIFVNDIVGVRKPPDSRFSKALSTSSAQYEKLYPSLAGPTLIVNLPFVLQAFVGLFKPLFPKSVQKKLKFVKAPVLASLTDLTPLTDSARLKMMFGAEIKQMLRK